MKNIKSSKKVSDFLSKNKLHKKDFAQMIGVTLSYVYNIIDETIPFSTRSVTIERIAVVMDLLPEDFEEYVIEQDPVPYNHDLETIKDAIKKKGLKTVDYLKLLERKKRLKTVDILRGKEPIPIDIDELKSILDILDFSCDEFYTLWRNVVVKQFEEQGFNIEKNEEMLNAMFDAAKKYLKSNNDRCNIS